MRAPSFTEDDIKARLLLHAIVPQIADVCAADPEARELVTRWRSSIELRVRGGPVAVLSFRDGTCRFFDHWRGLPSLGLLLFSSRQVVRLFSGAATRPLPWIGLWRGYLLRGLPLLTRRLQAYLGPSGQTANPDLAARIRVLILLRAISVLSKVHPPTRERLAEAPDGIVEISVPGAVTARATKTGAVVSPDLDDGHPGPAANVRMEFQDTATALSILAGGDVWSPLGTGAFRIRGLIPLAEVFFAVMGDIKRLLSL